MLPFILASILLLYADSCLAFEPKFYARVPNSDPIRPKIFSVLSKADQTIKCTDVDEIDVGIGESNENGRSPIYLKRAQVHEFLKEQREKTTLVIWFLKPIMLMGTQERQEILDKFKLFASDLGYKRVLIVVAAASGIYVVYDTNTSKDE